ncbi:MAG: transcription antitermination factor NusB [Burkholderiales bacterium]
MSGTEPDTAGGKPVSPRRRSRQLAAQMLYAWLLNPREALAIREGARLEENFRNLNAALFDRLIDGVVTNATALREALQPLLDRPVAELSPVEHVILLIGAEELVRHVETPYRVIINEAVELAKVYGGTDGHKYVNGVLDRLAMVVRPDEVRAR